MGSWNFGYSLRIIQSQHKGPSIIDKNIFLIYMTYQSLGIHLMVVYLNVWIQKSKVFELKLKLKLYNKLLVCKILWLHQIVTLLQMGAICVKSYVNISLKAKIRNDFIQTASSMPMLNFGVVKLSHFFNKSNNILHTDCQKCEIVPKS